MEDGEPGEEAFTFAKSTVRLLAWQRCSGPWACEGREAEAASKPLSCDLLLHKQTRMPLTFVPTQVRTQGQVGCGGVVSRETAGEAGMFQGGERSRTGLSTDSSELRTGGERIAMWESAKGKARLPKPRVVLFSACWG